MSRQLTTLLTRTPVGWTTISLTGGWSSPSGFTAQYRVDALGVVWLRGKILGGTGTPFTMPVGSRPEQEMDFSVISDSQYGGKVNVQTGGSIVIYMQSGWSSSNAVSLAGVTYLAEN